MAIFFVDTWSFLPDNICSPLSSETNLPLSLCFVLIVNNVSFDLKKKKKV